MENSTSSSYKTEGKTMNELIKDVQKGENKRGRASFYAHCFDK